MIRKCIGECCSTLHWNSIKNMDEHDMCIYVFSIECYSSLPGLHRIANVANIWDISMRHLQFVKKTLFIANMYSNKQDMEPLFLLHKTLFYPKFPRKEFVLFHPLLFSSLSLVGFAAEAFSQPLEINGAHY